MKFDGQYYRALIGTLCLFLLFYLGVELFVSRVGFLKWIGFFDYSIVFLIQLFINYRFIQNQYDIKKNNKN